MTKYRVSITFLAPILGTTPLNKELYTDYIASKIPDQNGDAVEDEVMTVPEALEKGTTGFHRADGDRPFIYAYVVKGMFKDACGMLRTVDGTLSAKVKAYKKRIDGVIFVEGNDPSDPVKTRILIDSPGEISILERPLRAQTPQGERVALARSEMLPAGSSIQFTLNLLDGSMIGLVREWLDYGSMRGFGGWRNADYGRFTYSIEETQGSSLS